MLEWLPTEGARRRAVLATAVYAVATLVYLLCAARETLTEHTPFNHFALQAEAWLHGRLDLGGPPPDYAHGNDFSRFEDRWFVPFPPFPALLLLPVVALSGGHAEVVADGRFFLLLAGLAPAALFLGLEKLRERGDSERSERENLGLTVLFALGSVYFFSAEQGTVWYAAHVVGAALAALYFWVSLGAARPWLAGLLLGLGFATRTPLLFAAPLFVLELARACLPSGAELSLKNLGQLDRSRFAKRLVVFAAPIFL